MSQKSIINFLSSKINLGSISSTPPPMEQEQYNPLVNPNPSTSATNDEQFSSAEEVDSDRILSSDEYEQTAQSPIKRKKYSRRKSKFEANYAEKFKKEFIQRSCKDEYQFFCKACDQNLKFRKAGERAIINHIGTEKHKKNVAVLNANAPLTDFVKRKSASEEKRALAAEISMAYHIAKHNFSMNSASCSSELLPIVFGADPAALEFASKRTKTTALIRAHKITTGKALKQRLNLSLNEEFYGEETMDLLKKLEQNAAVNAVRKLKRAFKQFYADSQKYLEDWSEQLLEASEVIGDWVIFESEPTLEKIRKAYKHFCGSSAEELDALFGEVAELQQILKQFEDTRENRRREMDDNFQKLQFCAS